MHLHLQSDSKHDAANAYAEAAKCYKKVDTNGMPRPLENLMVLYISQKLLFSVDISVIQE